MQDNKMIKVYLEGVEEERMRYKIQMMDLCGKKEKLLKREQKEKDKEETEGQKYKNGYMVVNLKEMSADSPIEKMEKKVVLRNLWPKQYCEMK